MGGAYSAAPSMRGHTVITYGGARAVLEFQRIFGQAASGCHAAFDNEGADGPLHKQMQDYLRTLYPGWDESKLIYKKEGPKC